MIFLIILAGLMLLLPLPFAWYSAYKDHPDLNMWGMKRRG